MLKKCLAVFPGQGSQFIGMGKDFYENFSIFQHTFEEASDHLSLDVKKLCFEGPLEELTQTKNLQPCLLAVSVGVFRVLKQQQEFKPDAVAGHSLGEYGALVATQSVSFNEAIQWVRVRGYAMQEAVPIGYGGMAAVIGLEDRKVQELCQQVSEEGADDVQVEPANFNAPGQVVVSGTKLALDILCQKAKSLPCRVVILPVSAPFHSRFMQPARQVMKNLLQTHAPKPLSVPYYPNVKASLEWDSKKICDHLIQQVDQPVLWSQTIQKAFEDGFDKFIELAPGKVLAALIKKIAASQEQAVEIFSIESVASISKSLC